MDNETWLIEEGDRIIEKKSRLGFDHLSNWEQFVYSLWVADYGMRNAGDLSTARDVYAEFESVARHSSSELALTVTRSAFTLPSEVFEERYFDLFDTICAEIRDTEPTAST